MKYQSPLLVSQDLEKTKQFYKEILGLEIICDFGSNITFTYGIAFQTLDTWTGFIEKEEKDICLHGNNTEFYFEDNDIDGFAQKALSHNIPFVHNVKTFPWGQRCIRVYDPDGYIIEVGESMPFVAQRFQQKGMSLKEIVAEMGVVTEDLVQQWLSETV